MSSIERDTRMLRELCQFLGKKPSRVAAEIGAAATTILRPFNGDSGTVLSRATIEKLRSHYPDFPGWEWFLEKQLLSPVRTIEEFAAELDLALIEEVNLAFGMGATYLVEEPEAVGFVPFRMAWLREMYRGNLEKLKVVRGSGDSMEPTIKNGDVVLIDTNRNRIDEQDVIWAISYGELGMIRRQRQLPGGSVLMMPDNEVVRPCEAHDGELNIVGRVIWIGRKM